MLTLITGTPGAGKSLYTVWELARKVPDSFLAGDKGVKVERKLHSNIKNLLVPHEHITADDLNCWHTWAKPGDVIVFDEVQEVWRPRGKISEVPECIAKLETHRHMGVDIILITQNPMLMDSNIRRLVNQHIHLRRLGKTLAMVYEWDGCMDAPGQRYSTALQSKLWFHPKAAYKLYKSAELHTKPTAKLPRVALVGLLAVAALAYMAPTVYGRFTDRFSVAKETAKPATPSKALSSAPQKQPAESERLAAASAGAPPSVPVEAPPPVLLGCIAMGPRCDCFDDAGVKVSVPPEACREDSYKVRSLYVASRAMKGYGGLAPMENVSRGNRESPGDLAGTPQAAPDSPVKPALGSSVDASPTSKPLASTS